MNILTIVQELRAEKAAGNDMAAQLVERIDAHIRDLELLKAWVKDSATARDMALGGGFQLGDLGTHAAGLRVRRASTRAIQVVEMKMTSAPRKVEEVGVSAKTR